jgi:hypothetical protein
VGGTLGSAGSDLVAQPKVAVRFIRVSDSRPGSLASHRNCLSPTRFHQSFFELEHRRSQVDILGVEVLRLVWCLDGR